MYRGSLLFILKSSFLQICHKLHIKFTHIKTRDVFPVQIYHIRVGYSSFPFHRQKLILLSPPEVFLSHKTIVWSVKVFYKMIGKIERKSTGCGPVQLRAHGLVIQIGIILYFFIQPGAVCKGKVMDCSQKIRVLIS